MTYCVGLRLDHGLVFMSDTRTNAGVDNVSKFGKSFTWEVPGERLITLMTAGNLATTQAVVSLLDERTKVPEERAPSILEAPTMFQVAQIIGDILRDVIRRGQNGQEADNGSFGATLIVGGQIKGMEPRLFMIYPEGNFIEACEDTPFFQIGESKYGRPILVRVFRPDMTFDDAVKLLMVSFDSTMRANLSVGPPFDLRYHQRDRFTLKCQQRIDPDDPMVANIAEHWEKALVEAFNQLPAIRLDLLD